MRLLNASTLAFAEFFDKNIPRYFMLSHRWSKDEVSYKDVIEGHRKSSAGYQKILYFCKWALAVAAQADCLKPHQYWTQKECWVWIDTCCIDKSSSAELSLAINSMYQWYQNSLMCCVYLADVSRKSQVIESEWFTRGWTLQELLAPSRLVFVNCDWKLLGHRCRKASFYKASGLCCDQYPCELRKVGGGPDLNPDIEVTTGIPEKYLGSSKDLGLASVAQRFSWASRRNTTKKEDEAYCLMGLLNVNMPLLYGEGEGAFARLQEQIIKRSNDLSIFAWHIPSGCGGPMSSILAHSPKFFIHSGTIELDSSLMEWPYSLTNSGLQLQHAALHLKYETRKLDNVTFFALPLQYRDTSADPQDARVYLMLRQDKTSANGNLRPETCERGMLCIGRAGLKSSGYIASGELQLMSFLVRTGDNSKYSYEFVKDVERVASRRQGRVSVASHLDWP